MSQNEKPYPTSERDFFDEYVENETRNPFARIFCRVRTLVPTLCDGTCSKCMNERSTYLEDDIRKTLEHINNNPETGESLDHEWSPITRSTAESLVREKIALLDTKKTAILENVRLLGGKIDTRLHLIQKQVENPAPPTRDLLQ